MIACIRQKNISSVPANRPPALGQPSGLAAGCWGRPATFFPLSARASPVAAALFPKPEKSFRMLIKTSPTLVKPSPRPAKRFPKPEKSLPALAKALPNLINSLPGMNKPFPTTENTCSGLKKLFSTPLEKQKAAQDALGQLFGSSLGLRGALRHLALDFH